MRTYSIRYSLLLLSLLCLGCSSAYQRYYHDQSPEEFPASEEVRIFQYNCFDLDAIYNRIFGEYLIIGSSFFLRVYEDPQTVRSFAKSIGADLVLSSIQYQRSKTVINTRIEPYFQQEYDPKTGSQRAFETKKTVDTYEVDLYQHYALFLRNVKQVKAIDRYTHHDYPQHGKSVSDGFWSNPNDRLRVYASHGKTVGVRLNTTSANGNPHRPDALKFLFDRDGSGWYIRGNLTPHPAQLRINRFGYLEIQSACRNEFTVQFKREAL